MSKYFRWALLALLVGVVGCEKIDQGGKAGGSDGDAKKSGSQHAMGSGSVNLQKILAVLGLSQQLEQRRQQLESDVMKVQKEKQAIFDAKVKEIGEHPTDDQKKDLQKVYNESSEAVTRVRTQAEKQLTDLNNYALNVLKQKAAQPIATIAEKRGLAVVLLEPNGAVVYRASDADITDEVLEAIRTSSPEGLSGVIPPQAAGTTSGTPGQVGGDAGLPPLGGTTAGGAPAPAPAPVPAPTPSKGGDTPK